MNTGTTVIDDATLSAYVNGTAPEDLRDPIDRQINASPQLRDEYRQTLRLRRALQQPLTPSPGDFGLDRLNRDIDLLQSAHARRDWRSRLQDLLRRLFGPET